MNPFDGWSLLQIQSRLVTVAISMCIYAAYLLSYEIVRRHLHRYRFHIIRG